ncbi:hypothetical protein D3C78_869400 [compost metagenome]
MLSSMNGPIHFSPIDESFGEIAPVCWFDSSLSFSQFGFTAAGLDNAIRSSATDKTL